MPSRVPKSYDEITRKTVPEPDGSWRPSDAQEVAAYEGFHALDRDEQELHDRVTSTLAARSSAATRVTVEVERDRVTLRGPVHDAHAISKLLDIASRVSGVREIVDRLFVSGD